MDMSLLHRPLEVASLQYAINYAMSIGYRDGAKLYFKMLKKHQDCGNGWVQIS